MSAKGQNQTYSDHPPNVRFRVLTACANQPPPCAGPTSKNLNTAIDDVKSTLTNGCAAHFDRFYDDLLRIAEGDPKHENKRLFSEFLVWSSDEGLLSQRQAKNYYNRFFNVKFMALACRDRCASNGPRPWDVGRWRQTKRRTLSTLPGRSLPWQRPQRG